MGYILTFNKETVPRQSKHVTVCQNICSRQRCSVHVNGIHQNDKNEKSLTLKPNGLRRSLLILLAFWLAVIIRLLIVEVAAIKKVKLNLSHLIYFPKLNIPETHTKELSSNASDFLKPLLLLTPPNEQHDTPTFTEKQLISLSYSLALLQQCHCPQGKHKQPRNVRRAMTKSQHSAGPPRYNNGQEIAAVREIEARKSSLSLQSGRVDQPSSCSSFRGSFRGSLESGSWCRVLLMRI